MIFLDEFYLYEINNNIEQAKLEIDHIDGMIYEWRLSNWKRDFKKQEKEYIDKKQQLDKEKDDANKGHNLGKLKNIKHKSKFSKKFNNKLQRWSYPKVLDKLSLRCEELGILFKKVNPAFTSQKCCSCGFTHKSNRLGENFLCVKCGFVFDADFNAAKNILVLGSL